MQKEKNKFAEGTVFEGMVSIRALLEAKKSGISDRKIEKILYTVRHAEKHPKEIAFLRHEAVRSGFSLECTDENSLESLTLGSSHGGIIATATARTIPPLCANSPIVKNGFYVMLEGIEDPYNFGFALRSLYAMGDGGEYGKLAERMQVPTQNNEATLSPETTSRFMKDTFSVSFSAMEKYIACPMKYWCDYGLGLKAEQKAVIDSRTAGTYVHYLMEVFFDLCDVGALSAKQVEELAGLAAEMGTRKYFPPTVMGQARAAHTVERLKETARLLFHDVADEFAQSGFRPICRELHIGGKDGPEKVIFTLKDGTRLAFGGYVDRVDAMEKDGKVYFRVVDYKTGNKTFSPSDVEKGQNLQILLYLVAIWKSRSPAFRRRIALEGDLVPACMEYVSLRTSEEAVDRPLGEEEALSLAKERLGRTGLALCDADVLRAMDKAAVLSRLFEDVFS